VSSHLPIEVNVEREATRIDELLLVINSRPVFTDELDDPLSFRRKISGWCRSMSGQRTCYYNAVAESFFRSMTHSFIIALSRLGMKL